MTTKENQLKNTDFWYLSKDQKSLLTLFKLCEFFNDFVKNNRFFSYKSLINDFLRKVLLIRPNPTNLKLRQLLSCNFRTLVNEFKKLGKIEKYNHKTWLIK